MSYEQNLTNTDFLRMTYTLMKKKVNRLIEIENSKVRGKLPLPLLKEKLETSSKILEALSILQGMLSFETNESIALSNIFNDIGVLLAKANILDIENNIKHYEMIIIILESFLGE